ncbi:ATPase, T2SS/T4P/T4SS family [Marinivivus vitaminiproducens]|uniref:ATPase, T2SS/T4P/T4SS family n=1 Tax=Marinivivus vitaminiproducens TaxID=3035935 RepID=UPI0027A1886D|nr:ATPase, T2SS/T4P/T4SS family [Geminicoccaceae bacterium SCSIO 64248]
MSRHPREVAKGFFEARLRPFLELAEREPALTEVLYDGGPVVVDIGGELRLHDPCGLDDDTVLAAALNATAYNDTVFSEKRPFVSVLMPPDWRVSFWRPPVVQRPTMALRKLRRLAIPLERYVETGVMSEDQAEQLSQLVLARKTVIVSGSVGSGKTTLLRTLLGMIPRDERIITIEDPRELMLTAEDGLSPRAHWVALEAIAGVMEMDVCLRSALRGRPDRIIVGEVRGPEALELVRALNTGHSGSLFTLHSNGAREALDRLHTLVLEAQPAFRFETVERAIDAVVQIDGRGDRRHITEIWENKDA